MPLGTEVGLGPGDIVLDADPAPPRLKGTAPNLWPTSCGQTAVCIKIPRGTEVGLSLGDIVLDGDPAPPRLKGTAPNFRPMSVVAKRLDGLRCLFMEVGLGPGHLVFDGDQVPPPKKKRHNPNPIFGPSLLWPNGWMNQDGTLYGGKTRPRRRCVRWGRSFP